MQRTSTMSLGFVLIFLGAQLALVDSYLLTPRISNFLSERGGQVVPSDAASSGTAGQYNPFNQAAFTSNSPANLSIGPVRQQEIAPPKWLCWPVLFCGTVVLLHGASMKRG